MGFGDLSRQRQADTGAAGFGGEERDEEVARGADAGTIVGDGELDGVGGGEPGEADRAAAGLKDGVDSVADEVDEELLKLVAVGADGKVGAGVDADGDAGLESSRDYLPPYYMAALYSDLGDRTRAQRELTRARRERCGALVWFNVDPAMDELR